MLALTTSLVVLGWISPAARAIATTAPPATTTTTATSGPTTTAGPPKATTTSVKGRTSTTTAITGTTVAPTTTSTTAPWAPFPPALLAIANSVKRTPPSNDSSLLASLAPLKQLGYTLQQAEIVGMGQFPIAGPAFYTDNWLEPRPGPVPKLHYGEDVVAAMGTPIRSPIDGILTYDTSDPTGYGLAGIITGPDKTYFLNGHMSATVTGLSTGSLVKQGQVIGFIGSTGDSTGPHDHFEIHPQGGAGIDPKPILDAWQAAAIKGIPELIRAIKGTPPPTVPEVAPLQIALPAPQAAYSPPPLIPMANPTTPAGSLAGLALVALLALFATGGLAVARLRPWPGVLSHLGLLGYLGHLRRPRRPGRPVAAAR